jgi:hypothetical protein
LPGNYVGTLVLFVNTRTGQNERLPSLGAGVRLPQLFVESKKIHSQGLFE